LIGNAVPPLLATKLGISLRAHIDRVVLVEPRAWSTLHPLPERLQSAIQYTEREERRNGASRRAVGRRLTA
jgi:DNA (cytosine-5)-methyltransferase 1